MFDFAVIGLGMIGSAALQYLSRHSRNVIGIGPDEPPDYRSHMGVFSSHYDQARITRVLDNDLVWAKLAQASIARYRQIEAESGMAFYREVGCLRVGQAGDEDIKASKRVGETLGVKYEELDRKHLKSKFPLLQFAGESYGLFEAENAGFINPRTFIKAQLRIAESQGARISRLAVTDVQPGNAHTILKTDDGNEHPARKVLITAGAFSNCYHLLDRKLAFKAMGRTILLAKIPDATAEALSAMPSILFRSAEGTSIYVLPPVKYPDGSFYVKLGGGFIDADMHSLEDFQNFFHTDGSPRTGEKLRAILEALLPGLNATGYATSPCVVAYTESDRPYIDTIVPSKVFVAAGGCGAAAKSSDEIGRLGASLLTGDWGSDLDANLFASRFLPARSGETIRS